MAEPSSGWLARLERAGNRLPHPTLLFVWLCLLMLPLSALLAAAGLTATHPLEDRGIEVRSLLDGDGLTFLFSEMVTNFTGFAPLGVVLVAMLGLGIAEHSGLLGASLAALVRRASHRTLVVTVAFAGVMSSLAFDAGYVVLIPLAGFLFQLAGRSPLAGIATAFAAVSGGYSANLLLGPVDAVLAGLSTEAAAIVEPDRVVSAAGNYWFIMVSTVLVTAVVSLVTVRITEPRVADRPADNSDEDLAPRMDRRALGWTLAVLALAALLAGCDREEPAPDPTPAPTSIPSPSPTGQPTPLPTVLPAPLWPSVPTGRGGHRCARRPDARCGSCRCASFENPGTAHRNPRPSRPAARAADRVRLPGRGLPVGSAWRLPGPGQTARRCCRDARARRPRRHSLRDRSRYCRRRESHSTGMRARCGTLRQSDPPAP